MRPSLFFSAQETLHSAYQMLWGQKFGESGGVHTLQKGALHTMTFGPHDVSNGQFAARVFLQAPKKAFRKERIRIEVAQGQNILAERVLDDSDAHNANVYAPYALRFEATESGPVSYRIHADDTTVYVQKIEVWSMQDALEGDGNGAEAPIVQEAVPIVEVPEPSIVEVQSAPPPNVPIGPERIAVLESAPIAIYEGENLPHIIGEAVRDENAALGWTMQSFIGQEGSLSFGPYTTDVVGTGKHYIAKFYLKTDAKVHDKILNIDVYADEKQYAVKDIRGTDFVGTNVYQPFSLSFTSPPNGKMEYRVKSFGKAAVALDRIEILERVMAE